MYVHPMWIKICGVNAPDAAREIAKLRPDAMGLNFYERSVRFVSPGVARQIAEQLPGETAAIGVFVDGSAAAIREAVQDCYLDGVQIHAGGGSDPLTQLEGLSGRPTRGTLVRVRAFQIGAKGLAPLAEYFDADAERRRQLDAVLVDAQVDGMHGGTGRTAPWGLLRNEYRTDAWPRLILAGGLRPENVAEAIATVRPWGVDVASGVESAPGVKDLDLVARFIDEARRAFAELESLEHGRSR